MSKETPPELFHPWARKYSKKEMDRMVATAPPHLKGEVRRLITMVNEAHKQAQEFAATGRWFHASPHELPVGTTLVPNGAPVPTSAEFYAEGYGQDTGTLADMGASRSEHLWVTTTVKDAKFWAKLLDAQFIYEVQPTDEPRPWNGTGVDGWVTTAAVIIEVVSKP